MKTTLRPQLLVAAAVTLFVAVLVLATPATATHGQSGEQLPFRGTSAGALSDQEFAPGFPVERSTFDGRCSVPSDFVVSWDYTGRVTGLGSLTIEATHCSQLDLAAGVGTFGDGVWTAVAANGDTVTATYENGVTWFLPDGTATYTAELTITGGTGRFAGATGQVAGSGTVLELDVTVTPWKATVVETYHGWIDYDASQRSEQ